MLPPRLLLIVFVLAAAAGGAWLLLGEGEEGKPNAADGAPAAATPADRALLADGGGPAGSASVALNRWRYRADPGNRGARAGWADGHWTGRVVRVPHVPNARAVNGAAGRRGYAGSVGWYAREVRAPVAGRYAIAFESAHHRATVYVDGRPVRRHVGAYEPFSARLRLRRGRHTIAVRVDWRSPRRQADRGYARGWFNYGGLARAVTLTRLGRSELGALKVRTRLRGGGALVNVSLRVRNHGQARRRIGVRGALEHDGRATPLRFDAVRVAPGRSKTARATAALDDPALWSPQDPQRYELRIAVPGEATLRRTIGLRELTWGRDGLALNGEPLELRGAALPPDARGRGDALRPADEQRLVDALRSVGANATRSQLPLSESLLERLDAAGILVWQLIGPWEHAGLHQPTTPTTAARDRAVRVAETQQPHASILTWTLTNEIAGDGRPDQRRYVRRTTERLHALDPTRPVAVDIWGSHLPSSAGGAYSDLDAIGVTDYIGWYSDLDVGAAAQSAVARTRLARLRALFPDKPIVVTELGAIGSRRAGGAFGGLRFQADLLARRIAGLRGAPGLSGTIVWALRDYALRPDFLGGSVLKRRPGLTITPGLNEKGLYDFAGRPKPSLAAVRRAFARGG
jgi:Glycosyl hydrolases family 2, TIM barrel domain/Glycosyl hydrolases family 2, sugar binding domain/Glycosyl hydrolases family 2